MLLSQLWQCLLGGESAKNVFCLGSDYVGWCWWYIIRLIKSLGLGKIKGLRATMGSYWVASRSCHLCSKKGFDCLLLQKRFWDSSLVRGKVYSFGSSVLPEPVVPIKSRYLIIIRQDSSRCCHLGASSCSLISSSGQHKCFNVRVGSYNWCWHANWDDISS